MKTRDDIVEKILQCFKINDDIDLHIARVLIQQLELVTQSSLQQEAVDNAKDAIKCMETAASLFREFQEM